MRKIELFFLSFILFIPLHAYCQNTIANQNLPWVALLTIVVTVFLPIPTIFMVIIPSVRKWCDRIKTKKEYRKKIKTEVDLLVTSYSGKKDIFNKKWENQQSKGQKPSPVKIPESDKVCFNNISKFSIETASYLSEKERDFMHELYEIYRKGKYMRNQTKVLNKDDIIKITELSKKLQILLSKKI
jgi:hypothetical protein